jgi:transposase
MAARRRKAGNGRKRKTAELKTPIRTQEMEVIHPLAAGIDVGNEEHYVAVPPHLDKEPVRTFGCCTADLLKMAGWLQGMGITTVALQSTGVYWIPLYDILSARGMKVFVVNARDTKNLPGRKSDVQECQWILKLHAFGLLRNSFRPREEICLLRSLWRQRQQHVADAARCTQRMQKALTQMNVQLANVISDIMGVSGQAIIRAILRGERDGKALADLCQPEIRASHETVARSLEGNWRDDHLFVLRQQFDSYSHFQRQIEDCDKLLQERFRAMKQKADPAELPKCPKNKRPRGNAVRRFDVRAEQYRVLGVDLTKIDGVNVMTVQTLISEIGLDVSAWETEGQFVSWLNLAPKDKISGGRVIGRDHRKIVNRVGEALRIAAGSLRQSQSYLGAQYRRLRARLESPRAIKAMAAKLARLIYRSLKYGQEYVDKGAEYYNDKYREQQIRSAAHFAAKLGFKLTPAA